MQYVFHFHLLFHHGWWIVVAVAVAVVVRKMPMPATVSAWRKKGLLLLVSVGGSSFPTFLCRAVHLEVGDLDGVGVVVGWTVAAGSEVDVAEIACCCSYRRSGCCCWWWWC